MASITIRNIDGPLMDQLRINAARNGNSIEEEARMILGRALIRRIALEAWVAGFASAFPRSEGSTLVCLHGRKKPGLWIFQIADARNAHALKNTFM